MKLSTKLSHNISTLHTIFPVGKSFDIITRDLHLGETRGYWVGINGFCRTEILQQIFSDLQNPLYTQNAQIEEITRYVSSKIGYAQTQLTDDWDTIALNLASGPSVLFIDGFAQAILLDVRTYPTRSVAEPETERVTKGARDGFVETMLFNTNLIRRRIRSPKLTFEVLSLGTLSQTDVTIAYVQDLADELLVEKCKRDLRSLKVSSLTMGAKSLDELLVPKSFLHPLPSVLLTERPDVACSFLAEGYVAVIVDNSPSVLILPCNVFQFTQSPEDYYKSSIVGTCSKLMRFLCIPINLLLLPVFLLLTVFFPQLSAQWNLLSTGDLPGPTIIFYIVAVEFFLNLFKYAAAVNSGRFSGSLAIIGGLIIGDIAVDINWVSTEILFYAALTLLTEISLANIEFADGLRIYRLFLIGVTAVAGLWGFCIGLALVILSTATTPVFGNTRYLWPLIPFHWKALRTLLRRYPTAKSQPPTLWRDEKHGH